MGLPVLLAAPIGEATRLVEKEEIGICVAAGNPGELARALQFLMENSSLRLRLSENSKVAASRHSRERQAKEMLEALKSAIGPRVQVS